MSVHVISWVLRCSEAEKGDRLVLIVLADHADGDGGNARPGVPTIQREARLRSRRATQGALRHLEADGRIVNEGIHRPTRTTVYRVVMSEGAENARGAKTDTRGRKNRQGEGAKTDTAQHKEPSLGTTPRPGSRNNKAAEKLAKRLEAKVNEVAGTPDRKRVNGAWLTDIERLLRIDKRTVEQVEWVIDWLGGATEAGQFWAANVQSGRKLREKFDTMVARIRAESPNGRRRGQGPSSSQLRDAAAALRRQGK
jgi:hypothetical protein